MSSTSATTPGSRGRVTLTPPDELLLSLLAGGLLVTAWLGERHLGFPAPVWQPLYVLTYMAGGWYASLNAIRTALRGRFDIHFLMVIAALGAAVLGEFAEGGLLLFLFSLGHALEHRALGHARRAITSMQNLVPDKALVLRDGMEKSVPASSLLIDELIIVRPGERLPADGVVTAGDSTVDQAPITGESVPVSKHPGSEVYAGTINGDGSLQVRTTRLPEDTTLARVIRTVEEARKGKAPSQRFAERFTRWFAPLAMGLALLVIFVPPVFGAELSDSFRRGMVLLVAMSPCALALSAPAAVLTGIARAARSGVLVKGGAALEQSGTIDTVVLDKTGTLTHGRPRVVTIQAVAGDETRLLRLAAAVERRSAHPLASAVVLAAEEQGISMLNASEVSSVTGQGVHGIVEGIPVLIGGPRLLAHNRITVPEALVRQKAGLEAEGKTVSLVAADGQALGLLAFQDTLRPGAAHMVRELHAAGIGQVILLTGDNAQAADFIGRAAGVDRIIADALPEDKVAAVLELQSRGARVAMVGDGVNDAPALATANLGVAMGGAGTDVALETADMVLMADDLSRLPFALALGRALRRTIAANLVISLGVIAILAPSAVFGLAGIGVAIVLHEGSTLVVIGNALRLLGFRRARERSLPAGQQALPGQHLP